jgi:methylmalonyl-CoA mutase C-terminal domain/subunit
MTLFPAVVDLLREKGASEVVVFGGGIIPQDDVPKLKEKGVSEVFLPGSSTQVIIDWIRANIRPPAQAA